MTSRIIVNNIESDTGVSTITISSPVNLNDGFSVGTGVSISSPSANILRINAGIANSDAVTIGGGNFLYAVSSNAVYDTNSGANVGDYWPVQFNSPSRGTSGTKVIVGSAGTTAYIGFAHTNTSNNSIISSLIVGQFLSNTAGSETGKLAIYTKPSGNRTIERVIIDPNGYVTIPFQPAFRATRNSSSGSITITSAQRLPYDSTSDGGGFDNTNSYNTSTYAFTAPVSGVYFFQGSTYTDLNTESMWDIRVNGNIRQRAELRQSGGDDIGDNTIINASCIVSLATNDVVDIYWASNSVQLISGSGLISFSGAKIS